MRRISLLAASFVVMSVARSAVAAEPVEASCLEADRHGDPGAVTAAIRDLEDLLSDTQIAAFARELTDANAIGWSNLPVGVVPRQGLRLGDLDARQTEAAQRVFTAALSACGKKLLDEIRLADDYLIPFDKRPIGWDGRNYYLSLLTHRGVHASWMLQVGGHHLAYNFTFAGNKVSATPLFFGSEPIRFTMNGAEHEPLAAQSSAMSQLAKAVSVHPQAKLSGTFTDVVKGVVVEMIPGQMPKGGTDTGFPHSYPTGSKDRGVPYGSLSNEQQKLVRAALESYASLPGSAISRPLVAAYESPAALALTYVGYAGATDLSTKGSYVRIDGPRIWMEFVVQPAVAKPEELHYHALWRDKQADYAGEVGK